MSISRDILNFAWRSKQIAVMAFLCRCISVLRALFGVLFSTQWTDCTTAGWTLNVLPPSKTWDLVLPPSEARRDVEKAKTQGGVRLMSQARIGDLRASPHQIHSKQSLGASLMRGKSTSNNACVVYSTPPRLSAASWLAVARAVSGVLEIHGSKALTSCCFSTSSFQSPSSTLTPLSSHTSASLSPVPTRPETAASWHYLHSVHLAPSSARRPFCEGLEPSSPNWIITPHFREKQDKSKLQNSPN